MVSEGCESHYITERGESNLFFIICSEQLPYHDEALDSRLKLMQEVVRTIRSMRQDYLPPKARPEGVLSFLSMCKQCICVC